VASLSQGRTAAAQCGLFTYKSVPVIFEPPCINPLQLSEFNLYYACFEGTSAKEPVCIPPMPEDIDELKYRDRGGCATAEGSTLRIVSFERQRILALKVFKHKDTKVILLNVILSFANFPSNQVT